MDESYAYCSLPPVPPREFPAGTDPARVEAIVVNESKWVNHTVLHYYFFDRETDGEQVFGADGTSQWRPYLGRQILDRGANERAMNFGRDLLRTPREADTRLDQHYPFPAGLIHPPAQAVPGPRVRGPDPALLQPGVGRDGCHDVVGHLR